MREDEAIIAVTGSALLTNAIGLHARPAVKLTQLAKSFGSSVEVALAAAPAAAAMASAAAAPASPAPSRRQGPP